MREQTVCIEILLAGDWFTCSTGFYIDEQGTVMTAQHAVDGAAQIIVSNYEGVAIDYVVTTNRHDLGAAILQPMDTTITSTSVEVAPESLDGQLVFTVGYPETVYDDAYQLLNTGYIAASFPTVSFAAIPAAPGSSGSPVFDIDGKIIGFIEAIDYDGGPFTYIVTLAGKKLAP